MSSPPQLELKIPSAATTVVEEFSFEKSDLSESPSSTVVSSCSFPSSEDGLLNEHGTPNLATLHLLIIHIGLATFLILLFACSSNLKRCSNSLPSYNGLCNSLFLF